MLQLEQYIRDSFVRHYLKLFENYIHIYIYIHIHLSDGDTIDLWNIRTGMPWGSTFAIVEGDLISEFRKPYEPKDFPINTHGGLLAFGAPWEVGCAERVDKKDYGICCTLVTNPVMVMVMVVMMMMMVVVVVEKK